MESTIIAANTNSSKTWGCRLWEHLSCIICQKSHAQQVIILFEYVVIICNLHCTAVGMFVLPSKSSHPSPARFWDISLRCSFIFGRNDEPVCCIQTMQKHTSACGSLSTFGCFLFNARRLSRTCNELSNGIWVQMICCQSSALKTIKEASWYPALGHRLVKKCPKCNLEAVAGRILQWCAHTPDALLIFVTRGHNCLLNKDIYDIYSVLICRWNHPLSVFHVGHYLMIKVNININYVTHDIINLLPTKVWWVPLLMLDTIRVLIMMMKGMIIRCFKLSYEHETSLEGPSPSEWLLARTSQLQSIIELLLSYMVTLSKLTNGKFLHTPLNLSTVCIHI